MIDLTPDQFRTLGYRFRTTEADLDVLAEAGQRVQAGV